MLSKSLKLLLAHVFIQEKDHLQLEMITDMCLEQKVKVEAV